jgi:dienelactone hydrolase
MRAMGQMHQATPEVRSDAGGAMRFSPAAWPTGGFDGLPDTRPAFCRSFRPPGARSSARNDVASGECWFKPSEMPDDRSSCWERIMPIPLVALLLLLVAATSTVADPQAGPAGAPLGPKHWQQWLVPITTLATGSQVFLLETVIYRPSGDGPFPLVIINHGKPRDAKFMARTMHPVFDLAAGWFVDHGFAVAIPMRRGYGSSQGEISDLAGDCDHRDYFTSARMHAPDIEGVITYMQRQKFVDPNNIIVLGHSWGGLGALGVAYDAPHGLIGILNFAGGGGSFAPGQICGGADRLIADVGRLGTGVRIPQIWLYAENDHFFAPPLAHAMFEAYRANAQAPITFVDLPPFDYDGHSMITRGDPALWGPAVGKFLAELTAKN